MKNRVPAVACSWVLPRLWPLSAWGLSRAKRSLRPCYGIGVSLEEELDRAVRPLNPGLTHTEGVTVFSSHRHHDLTYIFKRGLNSSFPPP